MGSLEIVVINPISDFVVCLIKRNEIMLPHTFLFETSKESLNHAVLFRRVRRYILLIKPIFRHCFVKPLRTKDKSVVGSNHKTMHLRHDLLPNQRIFQSSGRDSRLAGSREPPTYQISVITVDYCHQVAPTILFCEKMRHIDRPAAIGLWRDAFAPLYPWTIAIGSLPTLPAVFLHDPMDLLVVEGFLVSSSQYGGDSSCPILRKFLDHLAHFVHKPCFIGLHVFLSRLFGVVHIRAVIAKDVTDLPYLQFPNCCLEFLDLFLRLLLKVTVMRFQPLFSSFQERVDPFLDLTGLRSFCLGTSTTVVVRRRICRMIAVFRFAVRRCCSPISPLLVHSTWSERRGGHYSPSLNRSSDSS